MNVNSPLHFDVSQFTSKIAKSYERTTAKVLAASKLKEEKKTKDTAQEKEPELKQESEKRTDRQEANHAFLERLKETAGDKSNDKQLQRIMEKFNAGQKLTPQELSYVAERDPEGYKHVAEVTQKRAALEQQMRAAKTKNGAEQAYAVTMQIASKPPDEVLTNQLNAAYNDYSKSKEFLRKPTETELAHEEAKLLKGELAKEKKLRGSKTDDENLQKDIKEAEKIRQKRKKRGELGIKDENLLITSASDFAKSLADVAAQFALDVKV